MEDKINYFWIRVFDYVFDRDSDYNSLDYGKGAMIDEFYLKDIPGGREEVKRIVRKKYSGNTSNDIAFAKPKKKDGIYAIVMDSDRFFYDRFYTTVDSYCFWHECHKHIQGKASEFPKIYSSDDKEPIYFCSYECKSKYYHALNPMGEGEFQSKEEGQNGDVFGYIYLIYNRLENVYYIGQTRYLPFFRWQEHIKAGGKGDIKDLSFSVLTEVAKNKKASENENQAFLNSYEAWWIKKYEEEGHKVFNITRPKITLEYLQERFDEMVAKNHQIKLLA